MSNEAKIFLDDICSRAEHLDELLCGGTTKSGNFILATSRSMSLTTLIQIRRMLSETIKEMKDAKVSTMVEL